MEAPPEEYAAAIQIYATEAAEPAAAAPRMYPANSLPPELVDKPTLDRPTLETLQALLSNTTFSLVAPDSIEGVQAYTQWMLVPRDWQAPSIAQEQRVSAPHRIQPSRRGQR